MKMKNYISNLTNDELEWLCSEIPCERYEVFFRSHPDEFDQINISNPRDKKRLERCVNKILSSLTLDSVILFLNQNAENILVSFSKVLQCNEQNKTNQEILMAKTLRLFHFGGRVTLYFKLSNELDKEYLYIEKMNGIIKNLDLKNVNDWEYGMATLSDITESKNRQAVISVKDMFEKTEPLVGKDICKSISWLKGMFNRILRHDCWDWYTVNSYFNYPTFADLHAIVVSLASLRKAIINDDDLEKRRKMITLVNHNFLEYCNNYLVFDSEKRKYK